MPTPKEFFDKLDKTFDPTTLKQFLSVRRQETITDLRDSIQASSRVSTGVLQQSVDVNLFKDEGVLRFQILMEDYWDFVDKGVNGRIQDVGSPFGFKKKNISQKAAKEFVTNRGVTQWKDKNGNVVLDVNAPPKRLSPGQSKSVIRNNKFKSLYWLAGRAISNYGIGPTNFFTSVINDQWIDMLREDLEKMIAKGFK